MKKTFILDACALIAFFTDEPGADKVEYVLRLAENDDCIIYMNKLNILEIYYDTFRREDKEKANEMLTKISSLPVIIIGKLEDDVFKEAGRFKATYRISLADSIALAEAKTRGAELVTTDHHEFDIIEQQGELNFYWVR